MPYFTLVAPKMVPTDCFLKAHLSASHPGAVPVSVMVETSCLMLVLQIMRQSHYEKMGLWAQTDLFVFLFIYLCVCIYLFGHFVCLFVVVLHLFGDVLSVYVSLYGQGFAFIGGLFCLFYVVILHLCICFFTFVVVLHLFVVVLPLFVFVFVSIYGCFVPLCSFCVSVVVAFN